MTSTQLLQECSLKCCLKLDNWNFFPSSRLPVGALILKLYKREYYAAIKIGDKQGFLSLSSNLPSKFSTINTYCSSEVVFQSV